LTQQGEETQCFTSTYFGFSAIQKFTLGDNYALHFGSENTFIQAF
jgi:hypothetical protein